MVQTDLSQLSAESKDWRHILNNYRQEIQDYKDLLPDMCGKPLSKEQLVQVEQYHNQFHIQLINIHDLKQDIKLHDRKVQADESASQLNDQILADHESLFDQFQVLEHTIHELSSDF